jgi:hypothetical protein
MSSLDQKFPKSWDTEMGLNDAEQVKALKVLNSTIEDLSRSPVLNPYYLVQRLRDRLEMALGLTFDNTLMPGETGNKTVPLSPVNNPTIHNLSGEYVKDNGFLKLFPLGLTLSFQWVKTDKVYHVHGEIKPVQLPTPIAVSEKKE